MTEHAAINLIRAETIVPLIAERRVASRQRVFDGPIALLLEDQPLISIDIEMTLSNVGFTVFDVMSCKDAHVWLDQRIPDVVIVDVELRDGICADVVARLLQTKIPFVVYSGDHRSMHIDTPFVHGAWVNKPALPGELIRAACNAVAGSKPIFVS